MYKTYLVTGATGFIGSELVRQLRAHGDEVVVLVREPGRARASTGGSPVRGMADACLTAIGVETTAEAVGRHLGARADGGVLDGWLVHTGDTAEVPGVEVRSVPLLMTDVEATAEMARRALELAGTTVA